jgi:hypothetical protein
VSQPATVVTALCDSAALLLLVSGAAKVRAPAPTVTALRALHVRAVRPLARAGLARFGGALELALAGWVLAGGGRPAAAALTAAYLGFAAVALRLVAVDSSTSCGCFGTSSAPVGRAHLGVCFAGAAAALAAVTEPAGAVSSLLAPDPILGAVTVVLTAALTGAAYLCLTALPDLLRG